ncbi:MAG: VWA domain-containing protein [Pseudomonadota bacterium]
MRTRRREIEGISLSFLDVISCGFGAIILLLVLTKVFEPVILEETIRNLEGYLAALQEDLFEIRGETTQLDRELIRREDRKTEELERVAKLQRELEAARAKFEATEDNSRVANVIEGRLAQAKQSLTEEMERLLADFQKDLDNNTIGGIPVDSEYVIFIIDTSGSMREFAWPLVIQKVNETLAVYPRLKGIQVMNDQGDYMFSQYANEWIPDTAARRAAILDRMESWNAFSRSSPERGIIRAISTFYQPGRKISLYVFGDDFNGRSIKTVVDAVDRINRADATGQRLVRIHAIGFPVIFAQPAQFQASGFRFAHLMRILCERNGGTFVGLNDYRLL